MNKQLNPTIVLWVDDFISNSYISKLSAYLNPNNENGVTTPMSNKLVFDNQKYSNRTNVFNRPMMVLNYDSDKLYQKCYSMSSPKPKDNKNDLIYYFLPRKNKIVLSAPIDIPNKYLIIFEPIKQMSSEQNIYVKEYLRDLEDDRIYVDNHKSDILYQYQCIKYNSDTRNKFDYRDVQWAHAKMINEDVVQKFCKQELKTIEQSE